MAGTTRERSTRSRWQLPPSLPTSGNVLLAAHPLDRRTGDVCASMMAPATEDPVYLLYVAFTRAEGARTPDWTHAIGEHFPAKIRIIGAGTDPAVDVGRSDGDGTPPVVVSTETVGDPSDLTAIGIALTKHLDEWAAGRARIVACVRSLTSLLQYVELPRAYRFLDLVTGHLASVGALAHYHVDPGAHDDRTMRTLTGLFDAVVEFDGDGEPVVRTR